jgi:hypothetical protein
MQRSLSLTKEVTLAELAGINASLPIGDQPLLWFECNTPCHMPELHLSLMMLVPSTHLVSLCTHHSGHSGKNCLIFLTSTDSIVLCIDEKDEYDCKCDKRR